MERRDRDPRERTRELLDLRIDAGLDAGERAALEASATTPELAREQRQLEQLHHLLASGRVQARPGFQQEVMSSLPAEPAWATRGVGGWRAALGALAALVTLTMGLLLVGGASIGDASPALAALRAVGDFATAAALSGSGLLSASWRGVGMAVASALTLPGRVVFGIGVVALDAFVIVLLRRGGRRRVRVPALIRRGK